jgi:hypothetical protein
MLHQLRLLPRTNSTLSHAAFPNTFLRYLGQPHMKKTLLCRNHAFCILSWMAFQKISGIHELNNEGLLKMNGLLIISTEQSR